MSVCVCYSVTASPAQIIGPMTSFSDYVSLIVIGNQAITFYEGPEASASASLIF